MTKKIHVMSPNSLRNIPAYKDLSEEELTKVYKDKYDNILKQQSNTKEVEEILNEYKNTYDLEDLKPNDLASLYSLIQATILLKRYEDKMHEMSEEVSYENIAVVEKLGKVCSDLRGDISKLQDDLKISRKVRKNDKEESVLNFVETLKDKAKKFYQAKTQLVFCPKCGMLLANVWWLYPNSKSNRIMLRCQREMPDGSTCGELVSLTAKELTDMGGNNKPDIPDSLK